jgi:hypothetical protein
VTLKRYPETHLEICTCSLRLTERSFSVLTKYLHLRAIELDRGGRLTSLHRETEKTPCHISLVGVMTRLLSVMRS